MKSKKILPIAVLAMVMGVGLAGCNNSTSGDNSASTSVASERIVLKGADNKSKVILGQTLQLTSSVEGVAYESADPTIATVDAKGLVTGLKVGKVKIKATKKGYKEGAIEITVELEKITLTAAENKTNLVQGQTVQLTASQQGVTYTSLNAEIASVSATGLVTAIKAGEATIKATKEGFQDATITITVVRPEATAVLHFEDAAHYAADGFWENSGRGPVFTPVYEKEGTSDGTCIAYFGEGDKETLTFTSTAAVKAELTITIINYTGFEDLATAYSVKVNDTAVSLTGIAYEGNNELSEISLGEHNLVAGQNKVEISMLGNAPYIDDLKVYAAAATTVAVVAAPEMQAITVDEETVTIEAESTSQITCATKGVTFTSSNEAVATVDATGLITAVAKGNANISITKEGMKSARVKVTVTEKKVSGEIRIEAESGTVDGEELSAETAIVTRTASSGETITAQ
ncbi:MAG: Ig-like domain-containing protein, partial [Bacilli bacterium]|nr:Ig-like domain-containing protein [Bacilli bacterium]